MKKLALTLLKYAVSIGILAWLFWRAAGDDSFAGLRSPDKNWGLLLLAAVFCVTAITATIVRWYLLARAIKIPLTLPEALRLGFIGFLFTFLTMGVVGGDLVKAIFLARKAHGRKTEAVATVVFDRIIGLYALFVVCSIAIAFFDFSTLDVASAGQLTALKTMCWVAVGAAIAGTVGLVVVSLPTFGRSPLWESLTRVPKLGPFVERITTAVKIYRDMPVLMVVIGAMSLAIHVCFVICVYLIAQGIPGGSPTLAEHFVVVPMAILANTVPLPGGIGAFEAALNFLYRAVAPTTVAANRGLVVALGYRIATLLVAAIGVFYYLSRRQEVADLLHEAEQEQQAGAEAAS